jgi:hypothetical protein
MPCLDRRIAQSQGFVTFSRDRCPIGRSSGQQQDFTVMQWQRLWRILITASILVGLWWWTVASADVHPFATSLAPTPIEVSQLR